MKLTRFALVLSTSLVLAACGGGGEEGGDGGGGGGTTTDSVTMVDNAFEPADPVVATGSTLALTNEGAAIHSFTIGDEGIDQDVEPGAESSVDISLEAGEYEFICKYHPEMTGTLTVQ